MNRLFGTQEPIQEGPETIKRNNYLKKARPGLRLVLGGVRVDVDLCGFGQKFGLRAFLCNKNVQMDPNFGPTPESKQFDFSTRQS